MTTRETGEVDTPDTRELSRLNENLGKIEDLSQRLVER